MNLIFPIAMYRDGHFYMFIYNIYQLFNVRFSISHNIYSDYYYCHRCVTGQACDYTVMQGSDVIMRRVCVSTVRQSSIIVVVSQKRSACEWLRQQRV